MHYANGREAREGDFVVGATYPGGPVIAGRIHSLQASCDSCNGQVCVAVYGGTSQWSVTVGQLYHAEDALKAATPKAAEQPPIDVEATLVSSSNVQEKTDAPGNPA